MEKVNHPNHYQGKIEVIDYIEEYSKNYPEALIFDFGNVIKYVSRAPRKNGKEDLEKARWYLDRMIEKWDDAITDQTTAVEEAERENNDSTLAMLNDSTLAMLDDCWCETVGSEILIADDVLPVLGDPDKVALDNEYDNAVKGLYIQHG